ncbi:unnamed protein product [Vicia faba]|uniref:F-box associated beta-propeller type 1 domain-containing protein n=1 Tax=Vicia faba TaxID=3906 RepID=A0AAV0ZY64_VICFA|nr:unnamed protein product [Vicia faba]
MMDSGAVSDADLIEKEKRFYELKKSYILEYEKEEESISYIPLSFYTGSTVNHPGPMRKGKSVRKNFIPLSLYTTTVTCKGNNSSESKMGPMCKGNNSSESKMGPMCKGNNSSESKMGPNNSSESKMGPNNSSESKMGLMCKGNNSSESKMGSMCKGNNSPESKVSRNRNSILDQVPLSILSKLPIKSLKRFGCVRKSWSNLFENPDFMKIYTNQFISRHGSDSDYQTFLLINQFHLPDLPTCFYLHEFHLLNNKLKFNLPSPFPHSGGYISILTSTSVNGIFFLGQNYLEKVQYVLWNPATQEFMAIPSSPAELTPKRPQSRLYLEHYFHGFGYDQLRHDFKLIQYVSSYDCDDPHPPLPTKSFFEIYSLKSNSWRQIDMENDLSHWTYSIPFSGLEVYLHGACHWLVLRPINNDVLHVRLTLLSFDLADELFLTTPIGEESYTPYTYRARLAVLNGSIALISNYHDDTIFHISILGQLGVSQSWIKLYVSGPVPSVQWPPSAGFGKTGCIFFTKKSNELAYLDLSTQIVHEVGITLGERSFFITGLYKESLLSIGGFSH